MRTLRYGGDLRIGDFIGIAYTNCIIFGWYAGDGRGTLQYYNMHSPLRAYENYEEWKDDVAKGKENPNSYRNKLYKNGFTMRCLWKAYVNSVHATRVIRIDRPEELFTEKEDREKYEKAKHALIQLNFITKK